MDASSRTLALNEVHLYWIDLSIYVPQLDHFKALLNAEECERAARLNTPLLQSRFILARSWLRRLLSGYLNISATDLVFTYGEHGKPQLDQPFEFSLSHTEDYAMYAFSKNISLGVDLEKITREIDELGIAERFFSPLEFEMLKALPVTEQREGFFRIWTAKEAIGKALGLGLNYPLAHCTIEADPKKRLQVVRSEAPLFEGWQLHAFQPFPLCTAALAVKNGINPVNIQTFVV